MNNEMNITHKDVVVALDIGTTKVCAIAGLKNQHGKIEILGMGKVDSEGVSRGVVSNIDKTVKAIEDAIRMAQRKLNFEIKVVFVGIAGQHIKSLQHRGLLTRDSNVDEIRREDIERLILDMHRLVLPPGDKIIHVIPQEFTVDNEQGVLDPIGMSGVRLEANFHIITGQITASKNIHRCVERVGLNVCDMTLEPIASSSAVLTEEEKEAGIALIDMGGGTTDITIFYEGVIRHTAVIPLGGNIISSDIKEGCGITMQQAEGLKREYGSALADEVYDNRVISIRGLRGHAPKEISEKNLARIIQARVEEIFDYVIKEIKNAGFENRLNGGVVMTGGGSLLQDIEKLIALHTGLPSRIGFPNECLAHGYSEDFVSPIFSTGIGLLIKGIEHLEIDPKAYHNRLAKAGVEELKNEIDVEVAAEAEEALAEDEESNTKWYEKLYRNTVKWFEDEPDRGF